MYMRTINGLEQVTSSWGWPYLGTPPGKGPKCNPKLDSKAQAIIDIAADTSLSEAERAERVVRAIVKTYYPKSVRKFATISYDASKRGLEVTYTGKGEKIQGEVTVGKDFLQNTSPKWFARRVLQVGHEIIHVNQQRKGMSGGKQRARREFLAHSWTALAPSPPGTGCLLHRTRVGMIDCALRYFYCMTADQRNNNMQTYKNLLDRRPLEIKASGRKFGPAPSGCDWSQIASNC